MILQINMKYTDQKYRTKKNRYTLNTREDKRKRKKKENKRRKK